MTVKIFLLTASLLMLTACRVTISTLPEQEEPENGSALAPNRQVQCGSFEPSPPQSLPYRLQGTQDWVILGSSSAAGAGASSLTTSWVGLLAAELADSGVQLHNLAKGGHTTYHALSSRCQVSPARFQPDPAHNLDQALSLAPDLVILHYPSNDQALNYSDHEPVDNLLRIRSELLEAGVPVLVLSAQPRNMAAERQQKLLRFNQLIQPFVEPCFVAVFDQLKQGTANLDPAYDYGDGVHLNDAGHALIFSEVLARILSRTCIDLL